MHSHTPHSRLMGGGGELHEAFCVCVWGLYVQVREHAWGAMWGRWGDL